MEATIAVEVRGAELERAREELWGEEERRVGELAALSAHLSAATARWLELVWELAGASDDPVRFVAFRCGITVREARESLRVAEALRELPVTQAAFARGELTFTKVRALTRVATASSEVGLLELAGALTASQLERALRAFRRLGVEEALEAHELEFVNYYFEEDGSLYLRARLASEDGTLLVKALEAARERIVERRRDERSAADRVDATAAPVPLEPPRSTRVEGLLELAQTSLAAPGEPAGLDTRLVVHVDAAALTYDGRGRCELEDGPVICAETARRLGCDAEFVSQVEREGLPLSVGRKRRTVPPALRRLLEARDRNTCCFPGCERRRHLQAHHRQHWAHGGETSLDNLVLLCFHHHRLVHEGGYTIDDDPTAGLRFLNRHGLVHPTLPPRAPIASPEGLLADNGQHGLEIDQETNRHGLGRPLDLARAVAAIAHVVGSPPDTPHDLDGRAAN